jgi:hypothetical protein
MSPTTGQLVRSIAAAALATSGGTFAACYAAPSTPAGPFDPNNPGASGYELVFDDEFNGPSLDRTKWYLQRGWLPPLSPQYVSVQNGYLTISGDGSGPNVSVSSAGPGNSQNSSWVGFGASGGGYFEARWRFNPATSGNGGWPSFWSVPAENTYSTKPPKYSIEIDWEYFGSVFSPPGNLSSGSVQQWHQGVSTSVQHYTTPLNDDGQWHVNAWLWAPGRGITFYVDGQVIGTAPDPPGGPYSVSDSGQHMLVVLGTATGWPMDVDWVHVWQLPEAAAADGHRVVRPQPGFTGGNGSLAAKEAK